jgi:tetratricopeptide (TPR) repeat protein
VSSKPPDDANVVVSGQVLPAAPAGHAGLAVHRTVLAVDVEGFGDRRRTGAHQVAVREGLYRVLGKAFSLTGIPWGGCHIEDRGDGAFILAPPEVPKSLFVESLPAHLVSALREHNVVHSAPARIRLRMALHAGEMHLDAYGATGASINLAFRLLDARELKAALARAPGVLALIVSSWFFDEVVRNNPASGPLSYREVRVAVKETDTSAWIALPDGAESPMVPRQLPAAPRFVGRGAELERLTALLDTPGISAMPVCVISGTAGVGKTALAVRWAYQVADRFPDGQLYADLGGFGPDAPAEPSQVLYDFLYALGVDPSAIPVTPAALSALYRSLLAQRRMLVLLDNAAAAEQVRPLLPGDGQSAVVVTSRDRLAGLAAWARVEHVALDVLDTAEALQILVRQLGRGDDAGDRRAAAALTELCAGLPLALTITAGRIAARPALSLQRLVDELSDERTRLDAIALDAPGLDLRSVFSYSYQQLPDQAARLFRLLGLLPGQDIDIRAAAALAGTGPAATQRSIDVLLAAHLLDEGPPGRFRTHDLLRAYARDLAKDEGDRRGPLTRLFDYYLSVADQADRFITPHRHRAPLETREDTDPVVRGYDEAVDWLTAEKGNLVAMCRLAEPGFESRCWQLAYILRGFYYLTKRWDAWIQTHEYALAACLRSGEGRAEAMTRNNLGRALLETGRQEEAAAHYAEARRLFEELGDDHGLSNALANQATIAHRRGDLDEALRLNDRALRYYRAAGARRNTAITLRGISRIEAELGRLADAARHAQEGLDICIGLDLHLETAKGFSNLGGIHQRRGDIALAEDAYKQALDFSRRCGSRYEEAGALHRLGGIAAARGAGDEARGRLRRAYDLYRSLGAAKADQVAADLSALDRTPEPDPKPGSEPG